MNLGPLSLLPNSPGRDTLTIISNSRFPIAVDSPISVLPVAATSNRQNLSPLHIASACAWSCAEAKVGEKVGANPGMKKVAKDDSPSYVNKLSSERLIIPIIMHHSRVSFVVKNISEIIFLEINIE